MRSRELERHAGDVVQRIARALETPREEWPQPPPPQSAAPSTGVVELLQAVLRLRAEEAGIAPSLLATNADLQVLVQHHAAGDADDVPIMQGWRKAIAGSDLLALLEGRASVALDPRQRRGAGQQAARRRRILSDRQEDSHMAVLRMTHIGICVTDLERSMRFYRDLLGFTYRSELRVQGEPSDTLLRLRDVDLRAVYLERDGTRIELLHYAAPGAVGDGAPRRMNGRGLTHLSLRVDSVPGHRWRRCAPAARACSTRR